MIADRLDITGARWGLPGAEAVLRLRTLVSNNDLHAYWRYHLAREQERLYPPRPAELHPHCLIASFTRNEPHPMHFLAQPTALGPAQ